MKVSANNTRRACLTLLVLVVAGTGCTATRGRSEAPATADHGEINGARFALLVPAEWLGGVIVLAPGSRPAKAPLVAAVDPATPLVRELLGDGWLVATTSYHRNGLNAVQAGRDLRRLVKAIAGKYGPLRDVIVVGSSLGANAGLRLAEAGADGPGRISGVVALSAALEVDPDDWTRVPQVPVLFVSNHNEIEPVLRYARAVRRDRLWPAVWLLDRPGHLNLNLNEQLAAIRALAAWQAGGPRPPGSGTDPFDATVDRSERESRATVTKGGLRGRILAVDPIYGNIDTDLVAADLDQLGLVVGQDLRLVCGKVSRRARPGTTYSDVAKGELVVFLTADGYLQVAVNQGSAARRLHAHAGETLEIQPWIDRASGNRYH